MYRVKKKKMSNKALNRLAAGLEGRGELNISGGQSSICPEFIHGGGFFIHTAAVAWALSFLILLATTSSGTWPPLGDHPGCQLSPLHKSPPVFWRIPCRSGKPLSRRFLTWPPGWSHAVVMLHMTNKPDSLRASVMLIPDWPRGCRDAKLTLYQLTVALILCQLNQGFPCRACGSAVCACVRLRARLHFVVFTSYHWLIRKADLLDLQGKSF